MPPIRRFLSVLASCAGPEHYLFSLSDLRSAQPDGTDAAFRVLVSRAEHEGSIKCLCRDLYLYDRTDYPRDRVLYHAAARLSMGFQRKRRNTQSPYCRVLFPSDFDLDTKAKKSLPIQ